MQSETRNAIRVNCCYSRSISVVDLFYSERHLVLFAIGVLAHGAVIMSSGQGYCSLHLLFTLANWSDFRSITQPQLLLKL